MASSSGDFSDFLEVKLFNQFMALVMSLRTEIFLFAAAIVAHQLLFRSSGPRGGQRFAKKHRAAKLQQDEDGGATPSRRTPSRAGSGRSLGCADALEGPVAALEAACERGEFRQGLVHWATLKERDEATPTSLVLAMECMQRTKKEHSAIVREIRSFVQTLPNSEAAPALNDVLEALGRRPDVPLADKVMELFPALEAQPNRRTYEILLAMHFSARRFADVERVFAEMLAVPLQPSAKALMVAVKAALKSGDLTNAKERFRQLKRLWGGSTPTGSPSTAPSQIVSALIDLACREQQLHDVLPELDDTPVSEEAFHTMLVFCARQKDSHLAKKVESLARKQELRFTDATWSLLAKGLASDPSRVVAVMDEMIKKGLEVSPDAVPCFLGACHQISNVAAADRLYEHMDPTQLNTVANFVRLYVEQEQFEKACDIYEQYLQRAGKEDGGEQRAVALPDARLERNVMTAALRCGRAHLAKSFLQSSPSDVARHVTMIRNCASAGDLPGALEVFRGLEEATTELNCQVYNTVLDACVECRDVKQATAWMTKMRKAGMVDVVSYNTMIKVHLNEGQFTRARSLMEEMRAQGLQPNRVTYNELVNAFVAKGDQEQRKQVWSILDEMREAGAKPNQVTCSILLKSLRSGSPEVDVTRTMELIGSMEEPMDEVLLSSVIEACVRIGKPDLVARKLNELHSGNRTIVSGSHTFGSLIKAYGFAKDLEGVWRCWNEMRSRRIRPTSITLGCMVEAIVTNGDTERAFDLIHELQEDDHCRDALNSVIYCSVLKGFTREKKIDRVWDVYEEMQKRRVDLSIVTYNTIIDACARCGRTDRIDGIFKSMEASRIKPNVITFSTMVKGHCQAGDVQRSFEILDKMRADPELHPDEIMYNSLLDGCAQHNKTEEGLRLLQLMRDEGINPSNFTLSILVKLMSRARRLDCAFELVDEIKRAYRIRPNVHVFTNLMQACISNRALPRAMATLEEMIAARVQPEHRTYAILVNASLQQGQLTQAIGLLRGALGMKDSLSFLNQARSVAMCRNLDHSLVNDALLAVVDRGMGQELAVPFLADVKDVHPKVRLDSTTQCRVMSAAMAQEAGHRSAHEGSSSGSWRSFGANGNKGRGKGRAY